MVSFPSIPYQLPVGIAMPSHLGPHGTGRTEMRADSFGLNTTAASVAKNQSQLSSDISDHARAYSKSPSGYSHRITACHSPDSTTTAEYRLVTAAAKRNIEKAPLLGCSAVCTSMRRLQRFASTCPLPQLAVRVSCDWSEFPELFL
jgi:hypothetical protein